MGLQHPLSACPHLLCEIEHVTSYQLQIRYVDLDSTESKRIELSTEKKRIVFWISLQKKILNHQETQECSSLFENHVKKSNCFISEMFANDVVVQSTGRKVRRKSNLPRSRAEPAPPGLAAAGARAA